MEVTDIILFIFLPLGLAGGSLLATIVYFYNQRLAQSGIIEIDRMTGKTFEDYLALLFRQRGYRVTPTPYAGDYGADLIIEKEGLKTAVQAKRYKGKIGIEAIQQVVAAKARYRCQRAMVVTNQYFTPAAFQLARDNYVALWNRERLMKEAIAAKNNKGNLKPASKFNT